MPDAKTPAAKTTRTAPAKSEAKPPAPSKTVDRKRAAHVLGLPGDDGALIEVELFTGELAARRALDERPERKYLPLIPGQRYRARRAVTESGGDV